MGMSIPSQLAKIPFVAFGDCANVVNCANAPHDVQTSSAIKYAGIRRETIREHGHANFIKAVHIKAHRNMETINALDFKARTLALANDKADELAKLANRTCHPSVHHNVKQHWETMA